MWLVVDTFLGWGGGWAVAGVPALIFGYVLIKLLAMESKM